MTIFHKDADYDAFERVLCEGLEKFPVDLITYQWMRNHRQMVICRREDGAMSRLMYWVMMTQTARHDAHYHSACSGHLYQNRF
jgi:putative transposase